MSQAPAKVVLGSRSPQRLELLRLVVPAQQIEVLPPRSAEEPGFEGLDGLPVIEARLLEIARAKCDDVLDQIGDRDVAPEAVVAADTVIVASDDRGTPVVLGQPNGPDWPETVRRWFRAYYSGRTHLASTALRVAIPDGRAVERIAHSEVTFHSDVDRRLEWYIATGEPKGKAGGYAIQGAASIFVSRVEGSLSNIIGLPLEALLDAFDELRISVTI